MKNLIYLLFCILSFESWAQTMYTNGKDLHLANGQKIILRGINYPLIDEGLGTLGNPAMYKTKIDEAAKTGANAMRIPWYSNGTHWLDINQPGTIENLVQNGTLSDIIKYTYQKGMIPILELHDPNLYGANGEILEYRITCSNNWDYFNTVVRNFWKSDAIKNLIEENKEYLIINLANEFGYAMWTGNSAQGMNVFEQNYNALISELRALNINVPIMIDAPDCGQSSSELLTKAESMLNADPRHNLIFSSHAYWYAYANTEAAITAKINEIDSKNVNFIFGEIAKSQDVSGCGSHDITNIYTKILNQSCQKNIGWLAWTYTQDCHAARQMTTNGYFNTLTAYGQDLVYSAEYGLIGGGNCAADALATNDLNSQTHIAFSVFPNPAKNEISLNFTDQIQQIKIYDLSGKLILTQKDKFQKIPIQHLQKGNYVIQVLTKTGFQQNINWIKL